MQKFFKNKKGFTLVELVVVIAILGILAGIAIPNFLDATASARGAKVVADMRTIQSAEMIYYAKNATYPTGDTAETEIGKLIQGGFPKAPEGKIIVAPVLGAKDGTPYEKTITSEMDYVYDPVEGESGTLTLDGDSLTVILGGTDTTTGGGGSTPGA